MNEISAESRVALIRSNYERVLEQIGAAASRSGRNPDDIQVVVVSKAQPAEVIHCAVQAGIRIFGENYPEETFRKIQIINNPEVKWHMIGHLQSRKSKIVAEYFDWFQALDSLRLAEKLNRALEDRNKRMPILLEMNIGGEEGKSGWLADREDDWPIIADTVAHIPDYAFLNVVGLMTMPPLELEPEKSQVFFAKLRRLRDFIQQRHANLALEHLSMGTSLDFEAAVCEGATMIRVGQAILGPRPDINPTV